MLNKNPGSPAPATAKAGRAEFDDRLAAKTSRVTPPPPRHQRAVETGEVFQYELKTPITLEHQKSAMLPILTSAIPARHVSIFVNRKGTHQTQCAASRSPIPATCS